MSVARTTVDAGPWRAARALVGAGLALLGAASIAPIFGRTAAGAIADPRFTLPVAGAAALVAAICLLLGYATRFAPVSRVAAGLGGLVVYTALVVAPGAAVADGPRRLFTSAYPIDPAGPELATVVVAIGLATIGAVEPALRRRAALLPLIAPLVVTGLGSAASAAAGPPPGWLAPAYALGAAALLLFGRHHPNTAVRLAPGPLRRILAGVMAVAVLAGIALAGWHGPALLPGRAQPMDPRALVSQPVDPREATSPLALFPALRRGEPDLRLTVHTSHRLERLRYVALDRFDGQYWTTAVRYDRASTRLPLGPVLPAARERSERVEVTAAGPLGWLVSSGRPVEVSVPGLGVNAQSGDVVLPADRPIPTEYTVRSTLAVPNPRLLETATPARIVTDPALLSSEVGQDLAGRASDVIEAAGASFGYQALQAIEAHLRDSFRVNPDRDAPGGHGLAQLGALFDAELGTAEQFASAFAVLARTQGYDARVVVGFLPRQLPEPGAYEVTGRSVHAWVEVRFETFGWIRFDPTPTTEGSERADQPDVSTPAPGSTPEPPAPEEAGDAAGSAGPGDDGPASPARRAAGTAALAAAGLAGLVVLLALLVPAVKAWHRWRRRRARDPGTRTLAAWRETVDRLSEAGVAVAATDTTGEVTAAAGQRFGDAVDEPVSRLARLHNAAAFAPGQLAGPAADQAWQHADLARRAVRERLRPLPRLRAAVDPRPLLRRGRRLGNVSHPYRAAPAGRASVGSTRPGSDRP